MKLPLLPLFLAVLASATTAQEEEVQLPPGPPTFEAIDAALVEEILLPLGADWRYFRGIAEPSPAGTEEDPKPGTAWTQPGFDDSDWAEGPSPIGWGHADHATKLDGLEPPATTLYLRTIVSLADPAIFDQIHLELPVDDGYVCWLGGEEQDRLHAGYHGARAHDSKASWQRTLDMGPLPFADLTLTLKPGDNFIALQVFAHKDDTESLSVRPVVRARYVRDPVAEQARYELYARRLEAEGADDRLAYLAGRHLQRSGAHEEALPFLHRAAELAPEARLPWIRLVESHREVGTLANLDEEMRALIASGTPPPAMLDVWARMYLEDLDGSPKDLPGIVAGAVELPEQGFFADAHYAGSELAAGNALRVDCGAPEGHDGNGSTWGHDRFTGQRRVEEWTGDARPFEIVRVCKRAIGDLDPVYRVPVPDGTYVLALYLVSDGPNEFDVFVEGARAAPEFDPSELEREQPVRFPVFVFDGFLEIDVFPRTLTYGRIAGFVIEPVGSEAFEELARDWAEETSWHQAFPIVQLAEASFLEGDLQTAFDFFEQASFLDDFRPEDRDRMAAVEDALLPELLSYRMADDLLARLGDEAEAWLPRIQERARRGARRSRAEAAWDDDAAARALYFEGRLHQLAGHLDEAIPAFEELAFSGRDEPAPLLRFAECLVQSGLAPEAEGLLREGLFDGVAATPALLRLWISLNLDELERDPWEVVADLSELEVPDQLVVVPTSEAVGRPFAYLQKDPPSTTWSRPQFDASTWKRGLGGIGTETPNAGVVRSSWTTQVVFARTPFVLPGRKLLYPHARANADDAGDVYLNGTMVSRISARTDGYVDLPVRQGSFEEGLNYLGIYAINYRESGFADVGLHEPLSDLVWVLKELDEKGVLRINCGSDEDLLVGDVDWSRDRFYGYALDGGSAGDTEIEATGDDIVYRTQSTFTTAEVYTAWYQIPVPDGSYRVTLHFAELAERDPEEKPRPFTVQLEKQDVLKDHDVIANAGAPFQADVHTFEVQVTDGWLDLDFKYKQTAFVNAIEVEQL